MANEISISAALAYNKAGVTNGPVGKSLPSTQFSVATSLYSEGSMLVPITTPAAIPLGQIGQPHWCWLQNLDPTNSIQISNGSGGAKLVQLNPGEFCLLPLIPTAVPFAVALTAACQMEFLIVSL